MSDRHFAIIDPAAGISGDMLLGALIALGAPEDWLTGLPGRLGLPEIGIDIEPVLRCGITATKVTVRLPGGESEGPAEAFPDSHHHNGNHHHHNHHHLHDHHHHGAHRHVPELIDIIHKAKLSGLVRDRSIAAFRLLAEAEGRVHGVPAEEVALHEVGAFDALVDIVGSIEGFETLGVDRVYHRPVVVGSGWAHAAHGVIPIPAPATALLLEGMDIGPNGPVHGEATTPTGAVLLRVLSSGSLPDRWRAERSGWGAGGRDPAEYPNALRVILAEAAPEAAEVVTLATDLDDMSPEYLEPLRQALGAAGALDVQVWSTQMKKGRLGMRLEVSVPPGAADRVIEALFRHSTTTGVRRWTAERVTLPRRTVEVEAAAGVPVRVKVVEGPGGPRAKPEYDDVDAAARRLGRPAHEIAREVQALAQRLLAESAGERPLFPNEDSE
jgi:uncharacterized protein (TIGR00299 family) protein